MFPFIRRVRKKAFFYASRKECGERRWSEYLDYSNNFIALLLSLHFTKLVFHVLEKTFSIIFRDKSVQCT